MSVIYTARIVCHIPIVNASACEIICSVYCIYININYVQHIEEITCGQTTDFGMLTDCNWDLERQRERVRQETWNLKLSLLQHCFITSSVRVLICFNCSFVCMYMCAVLGVQFTHKLATIYSIIKILKIATSSSIFIFTINSPLTK